MATVLAEARLRVEGGAAPGTGHADGQAAGGTEARIDIQGAATPAAAHGGMLRAATGRRCRMADTWPAAATGRPCVCWAPRAQAGRAASATYTTTPWTTAPSTLHARLRHRYQVRFDEADARARLRPSGYLRYAGDMAWRHSEAAGFGREWYAERSLGWLVRNVALHITAAVTYGDTLTVTTEVIGWRHVWARRQAVMRRGGAADDPDAGEVVAVVHTDWVLLSRDGRPARMPAEIAAWFATEQTFERNRVLLAGDAGRRHAPGHPGATAGRGPHGPHEQRRLPGRRGRGRGPAAGRASQGRPTTVPRAACTASATCSRPCPARSWTWPAGVPTRAPSPVASATATA